MRALPLLAACLVLAGCNSITRLDSDSFAMGPGGYGLYERDDGLCRRQAEDRLVNAISLQGATRYARNRAYNRVYRDCMTSHGHPPRPYYKNWLPGLGAS